VHASGIEDLIESVVSSDLFAAWENCRSAELSVPGHLLYWSDKKNPGHRARQCDGGHDDEGPVKLSSAVQNKSGECGGHNTGEITDAVLETCPASRG